jgi:hypothetical protein
MMTDEKAYIPFEILAFCIDGEPGWYVEETALDARTFEETMRERGYPVIEVRSISKGARRSDSESDDGLAFTVALSHGWSWDTGATCWRSPGEMIKVLPGDPVRVDDVRVIFDAAEVGWQPVRIEAGGASAAFDASELYDPFPDILKWLEAIAHGGEGRVSAELEGPELELFAFPLSDPMRVRIVVAFVPGEDGEHRRIDLDINVDRRRFIAAFYNALRAYADSDAFVIDEWAVLSMRDDLIRKGFPENPSCLSADDATDLNEMLWKLYPNYIVSFPSSPDKGEELVRFVDYVKTRVRPDGMVEEPDPQFVVPEEYDTWDTARRQTYIDELLEEIVTPYHGSNLKTLRSPEIEAFLGNSGNGSDK